ncbi:MAG: F0F1 ATP synthase subunit A [Chloroflexi bacterium]|nr:F0F1 ATP synthase subunit A [Chloroflexota bacterium]MCL5274844.1 F0F1 ATP synthase subunit A [Chloroflexota bacterium]
MKPRTILLLAILIFACALGCMLGNFGGGIVLPINGQNVKFTAFIPTIVVPGELLIQPTIDIAGLKVGLYNTLFTTLIVDAVIIVLVILGRRGIGIKPNNWFTNAWEAYIEMLYKSYIVPTLGARARAVVPIAVAAFTFIMIAGFFELIPGHESIGVVEHVATGGFCSVNIGGATVLTGQQVKTSAAQDCNYPPVAGATGQPQASITSDTQAQQSSAGGITVVPFLRRPTSDLSTTLAMALVAFIFIEIQGVRANGVRYFSNFFRINTLRHAGSGMTGLTNYIQFGVGFLELLSEFIRIISFSFRLFGNMFAGSILVFVMAFIFPMILPTLFLALEFAIAIIQAFVFMMLIVVFTSLAVAHTEH